MMPHPTTMSFAWDTQVQRATQVLLVVLGLTIAVLLGGAMVIHHESSASLAVTADQSATKVDLAAYRSTVMTSED